MFKKKFLIFEVSKTNNFKTMSYQENNTLTPMRRLTKF